MSSVYLCSPTNSTMFTTCCDVAICDDQAYCPRCKQEVFPGPGHTNHERNVMRWNRAYGQQQKKGRS